MSKAEAEKGLVMRCIRCASERTRKDGQTRLRGQRWRCNDCGRRFTARSTSAFSHHGFPDDVIALGVRWYGRYRLSYADVVRNGGLMRRMSDFKGVGRKSTVQLIRMGKSSMRTFLSAETPRRHKRSLNVPSTRQVCGRSE